MHIYLKYHLFCTPLQLWLSIYYFAFIIEIVAWYYSNFFAVNILRGHCVAFNLCKTHAHLQLPQINSIQAYLILRDALWRKWLHKYT